MGGRSTVELLAHLLGDEELRHVLVIGACRDIEVEAAAPLLRCRRAQTRTRAAPCGASCCSRCPKQRQPAARGHPPLRPGASQPLARHIRQKTAGNPFFVNELLTMLHREGAFRFDAAEGRWDWDPSEIERAALTDNVVDLMVQRLRRLPADSLQYLCLAACLGSPFDVETLAALAERPRGEPSLAALREAVRSGCCCPPPTARFRFQHARLEQAADSLLDEEQRARTHLQIGERLLASAGGGSRGRSRCSRSSATSTAGGPDHRLPRRSQLAELNCVAGQRAHRAAAYASAALTSRSRSRCMSADEWAADPRLALRVPAHSHRVSVPGRRGRARSGPVRRADVQRARSAVGGAAFYLQARILEHQARCRTPSTDPRGPAPAGRRSAVEHAEIQRRIGEGIGIMQGAPRADAHRGLRPSAAHDRRREDHGDQSAVPADPAGHPDLSAAVPAGRADDVRSGAHPRHHRRLVQELRRLRHHSGRHPGRLPAAYRLGKVAFTLLERYAPTPLEAGLNFVFGAFVSHWRAPYREAFEAFAKRAQRIGLEMGDISAHGLRPRAPDAAPAAHRPAAGRVP